MTEKQKQLEQDVREATALLAGAIKALKDGVRTTTLMQPMRLFEPKLKQFAAYTKTDLSGVGVKKSRFVKANTGTAKAKPIERKVEPEQEEPSVRLADNSETPDGKKRAAKRRGRKPKK